jgi:hypothetical protein
MAFFDLLVLDIDGTLANLDHRLHLIATPPVRSKLDHGIPPSTSERWDMFYKACKDDSVIEHALLGVRYLLPHAREMLYCTGRPVTYRDTTLEWLIQKGFPYGPLLMRPADSHASSIAVKASLLSVHRGKRVLSIEDDADNIEMMHKLGFATMLSPHCWKALHEGKAT